MGKRLKFKRLQAYNFMTFTALELDLDRTGAVLVLGENRDAPGADSNGSGKSAIFDAICWCLYGSTIREVRGDDVVNRFVGKDCKVVLTIEERGIEYTVVRHQASKTHYKANDLEFFQGETSLTGNSISDTQAAVTQFLGFDFTTFRAFMPGAGVNAAALTDAKVKELLENILHLEALGEAREIAKNDLKGIEADISIAEAELSKVEYRIETSERQIKEFRESAKNEAAARKARIASIKEQIVFTRNEIEDLLTREKAAKLAVEAYMAYDSVIEDAERAAKEADKARLALLEEERSKQKILEDKERPIAMKRKEAMSALSNVGTPGSTCYACQQEISHEHVAKQVEVIEAEIKALNAQLKTIDEFKIRVDEEYAPRHKEAERACLTAAEGVKKAKSARPALPLETPEGVRKQILSKERELERLESDLTKEKNHVDGWSSAVEDLEKTISEMTTKRDELTAKLKDLYETKANLEFWVAGYAPSGVRNYMLRHITPILNSFADKYAQILTQGEMRVLFETEKVLKSGKTKEAFDIIVEQKHGSPTYAGSSMGERGRADLVISLALGDLAGLRSDKKIPFRFIDEAFEKVDEAGLNAIVRLLHDQEVAHGVVFVVTHNEALKQYFNETITIVKENSESRIAV